ncbi:MAG TPA: MlaD family protein [Solirubrobacteraceae bacterium]|nr:MlaD family protein [Solirubrobacteraceae bacterium]
MKRAIQKHMKDFLAIVAIAVIALLTAGFILSHQRFYLPSWVPIIGSDLVTYNAEFQTAQAVTPGQGQTVLVAGVQVGEISGVTLKGGRAVVQMKLKKKYTPIFRNATALLRPKTGLQDMVIELDPGNRSAGELPVGGTIPVAQTQPDINPDEILAGLDTDTRAYLRLLIAGGGQGLAGNAANLSATLKRFDPTARYLTRIGQALRTRSAYIRRSIHNFRLIAQELGSRDTQLAEFVDSSNRVFQSFANQQASLSETISLLPTALAETNAALSKSSTLSAELGPTLAELMPTANGLAPALKGFQDFAIQTKPVIENQLSPFTQAAQPTVAALRPAAANLATALPGLNTSLDVLNTLFNELAYDPPSGKTKGQGYLYWLGWLNHEGASIFGSQDAHGPTRRGLVFGNCASLATLEVVGTANPVLGTLAALLNAPTTKEVCGTGAGAAAAKAAAARVRAHAAEIARVQPSGLGPAPPGASTATAAAPAATTTTAAAPAKAAGG